MAYYLSPHSLQGFGGYTVDQDGTYREFDDPFGFGDSGGSFVMSPIPSTPWFIYLILPLSGSTQCFTSANSGRTWTFRGEVFAATSSIERLNVVAVDTSVAYVFDAAVQTTQDDTGIYRTLNGGATWSRIIDLSMETWSGWLDVATNKLFYAALTVPSANFDRTYGFFRANLDGSGVEQLATRKFAPAPFRGGTITGPFHFIVRALDDNNVLIVSSSGDFPREGSYVSGMNVILTGTAFFALGSPLLVTPIDEPGQGDLYFYYSYTAASWSTSNNVVTFAIRYQNDDTTWSPLIGQRNMSLATTGGSQISGTQQAGIPNGPRLAQLYAAGGRSGGTINLTGLTVNDTRETGGIYHITSSGTLTYLRPSNLRHPWDVLRRTDSTWVLTGERTDNTDISVLRTTDSGASWALQQVISGTDGYLFEDGSSTSRAAQHNLRPMLAETSMTDPAQLAMLGAGYTSTHGQFVWLSANSGTTWSKVELALGYYLPGGIYRAFIPPSVPAVAIPSRLATIVG